MRNLLRLGLWLALALVAVSCLTVEENYTFNKDGSGRMELALDLAQLAAFVPEGPERDSLFQTNEIFGEMQPQLDGLVGISAVETFEDRENLRMGIRYKFADLEALNRALNTILVVESMDDSHPFFSEEGKGLVRQNLPEANGMTIIEAVAQSFMAEAGDNADQVQYLLESMEYKMNLDFANRVKLVYAEAATELSGDENEQVSLSTNFSSILKDRSELSASFVLK